MPYGIEAYPIHHERIEPLTGGEEDAFDVIEFYKGVFNVYQADRSCGEFDNLPDAIDAATWEAERFDAKGIVPMTAAEASDYAPQWGSYMTSGDPGAYMYSLDSDGLPPDQRHADEIVGYIERECLPDAQDNPDRAEGEADVAKLLALRLYIKGLKALPDGEG